MEKNQSIAADVDEYIASQPPKAAKMLKQIRRTIRQTAPESVELISYRMPAYKFNGKVLIYVCAHASHIGIYPAPISVPEFAKDAAQYGSGKGTFQFAYDQPVPLDLVGRMVKWRIGQIEAKTPAKKAAPAKKARKAAKKD